MQDYDAKLGIYSVSDNSVPLTEKLETKYKDKYLDVQVFIDPEKIDLTKLNYLIINLLDNYQNLNEIKSMVTGLECKIIIIFPFYVKTEEKYVSDSAISGLLEINKNIGVILAPELLGDGVKYNEQCVSHSLIMQSLLSERIKISSSGTLINSITLNKLADRIVKETFSFGIAGQVLALIGPRRGAKSFLVNYLDVSEENIITANTEQKTIEVNRTISSKVEFSLRRAVNITKNYFLQNVEQPNPKKRNISKLFKILFFLGVFFIMPFLLMVLSLTFLLLASKTALSNTNLSKSFVSYSLKTVSFSQKISFGVPFYYNYSNMIYKTSFIVQEVLELSNTGSEFATKIMGKEEYDLNFYSDNISSTLDRIHTDIGFLQSDINELNDFVGIYLKKHLTKSDIEIAKYKNKVYHIKNFSSRLSFLLGMKKPMKYLILFQNNMELRPTGGFIGSFALVSFEKGKLTEMVVNDVYSADGQLKGHVDPPEALRTHLGEGGWFLRDANWDPDFPTSAAKIEWFLDKEINTQVDGVVAIDLSFVQKLLKITGPINLNDFSKIITAENLYVNTQNEVESDFFPGSIKKASFLTSLSKELISEVQQIKNDKYFALIKEIYSSLEERHLQLYFHDSNSQEAINNLGYAGQIDMNTDCKLRCLNDRYALVDANLGVNKSNIYIKREQEIHLDINKNFVSHELYVTYQNIADQSVGKAGVYKSYSRLLLPKSAKISGIRIYDTNGNFEDVKYDEQEIDDRREIGFLINILPSDLKKVQLVWRIDTDILANGGEYNLLVKKQAGTDNDGLLVKINKTDLTLTGRALSVYTTTLERDFSTKLFFKP